MDLLIGFLLVGFGILIGGPLGWFARGLFRQEVTAEDIANIKALMSALSDEIAAAHAAQDGAEARLGLF